MSSRPQRPTLQVALLDVTKINDAHETDGRALTSGTGTLPFGFRGSKSWAESSHGGPSGTQGGAGPPPPLGVRAGLPPPPRSPPDPLPRLPCAGLAAHRGSPSCSRGQVGTRGWGGGTAGHPCSFNLFLPPFLSLRLACLSFASLSLLPHPAGVGSTPLPYGRRRKV